MVLRDWLEKVKEVNLDPNNFFDELEAESFEGPVKFAAITGLIFGALLSSLILLISIVGQNAVASAIAAVLFILVLFPAAMIFNTFLQSVLVHLAVYIFGGRGFSKTYNAVAYPVVAVSLYGWIPFVNFLAAIYSIILQTRGVQKLHDMDAGKAFIAVIWPILLSLALIILLFVLAILGAFAIPVESINSTA